jgi:uncharacterized protein (DUF58 family)
MIIGAAVVYLLLRKYYLNNWNKKLGVKVKFSVSDAVCNDTFELIEEVTNEKKIPLPFVHLKFQASTSLIFKDGNENARISDATYRDDVFSLLMNQRITRRIPVTCEQRGVYRLGDLEMVFTGLFMNDVSVRRSKSLASVTIYPDPYFSEDVNVLYSRVLGLAERNSLINPDPFAFRQIREYDTSDPMNTINWKASARTGSLMVNQYNETTCQEVYILLNLEPEGMLVYERLSEASISIAAGIAEILLSSGVSVGLLSNGVDYETKQPVVVYPQSEPEHIKDINTALARIDLKNGQESFVTLLESRTDHFNKSIFETSEGKGAMYVIISQNTRDEVQLAVNSLLNKDSQSVFIATHFRDKEVVLEQFAGEVIDWEVSHNAKG